MFTSAHSSMYLSGTVLLNPALMIRVGAVTVQEIRTTVFLQVKSQRAFFFPFPFFCTILYFPFFVYFEILPFFFFPVVIIVMAIDY